MVWPRPPKVVIRPQTAPRNQGAPRPLSLPSSDNASAKPMLMPAPTEAARPTLNAAFATMNTVATFKVGLAASVGAGISMGFAEALSDDGKLSGRGAPWLRGAVCGLMTTVGGLGHTMPYLIRDFHFATTIALLVVAGELGVIAWIR